MSASIRIVVIGGSAAGGKAASRARRLDESAEITIIEKGPNLSVASCAFPQYVGGIFDNRDLLMATPVGVVRTPQFFQNAKNITALVRTEALSIDRAQRKVLCKELEKGTELWVPYDRLIIATGSRPRTLPVQGSDLKGVMTLHTLEEADALRGFRDNNTAERAVVIGAGRAALEITDALYLSGIATDVLVPSDRAVPFLDLQLSRLVESHIQDYGARVILDASVERFSGTDGRMTAVHLTDGNRLECGMAVMALGSDPCSELAANAGLRIGGSGGIVVDAQMRTSDPDIFAAGDCIEVQDPSEKTARSNIWGDRSNIQGRIAGENAVGKRHSSYTDLPGTAILRVFDMTAGSTGLSEEEGLKRGLDIETVAISGFDRPVLTGGKVIVSKMVAERATGRVMGFQCVGSGDVAKQVAQASMAIMGGLTVDQLSFTALPNGPSFSWPIDNLIACAQTLQNKMEGLFKGINAQMLMDEIERGVRLTVLDLRTPDEFKASRLGIGEVHIPLGALRKRKGELPSDLSAPIVCYCKTSLRGYEGARVLMQIGYENVKVLEGGIAAWPYPMGN